MDISQILLETAGMSSNPWDWMICYDPEILLWIYMRGIVQPGQSRAFMEAMAGNLAQWY